MRYIGTVRPTYHQVVKFTIWMNEWKEMDVFCLLGTRVARAYRSNRMTTQLLQLSVGQIGQIGRRQLCPWPQQHWLTECGCSHGARGKGRVFAPHLSSLQKMPPFPPSSIHLPSPPQSYSGPLPLSYSTRYRSFIHHHEQ